MSERNPALAEEQGPKEPEARTYRVSGTQRVLGHEPGDTFSAALDPTQEQLLVEGGALTVVNGEQDLASLKRPELDARALEAGVDEPEKLPNKQAVLDAIEAAQNRDGAPAPDTTEGAD